MTNNRRAELLKPGERLDDLQIGGLELIQNPAGSVLEWMLSFCRIS